MADSQKNRVSPAFLLHSTDYGESDRILSFFTQHEGKIRGIARGAKKSRKRFGGALDYFHLVKLNYQRSRGDLFHIESLQVIHRSEFMVQHLEGYALGSYFLEMVRELTQDHHAEPLIFDLLYAVLRQLELFLQEAKSERLEDLTRFFEMHVLDLLGLRPVLDRCVLCGQGKSVLGFSVERGGTVCASCLPKVHGKPTVLSVEAMAGLRGILQGRKQGDSFVQRQGLEDFLPRFSPQAHRQVRKMVFEFLRHHTHKTMRSLDFLDQMQGLPGFRSAPFLDSGK